MTATDKDQDILARTLWGEARGEGVAGQIAVAWSIRNRVEMDLHNDGKSLGSGNFTVTWHGNIPTVTTHGEEQPDQSYTFNWK